MSKPKTMSETIESITESVAEYCYEGSSRTLQQMEQVYVTFFQSEDDCDWCAKVVVRCNGQRIRFASVSGQATPEDALEYLDVRVTEKCNGLD